MNNSSVPAFVAGAVSLKGRLGAGKLFLIWAILPKGYDTMRTDRDKISTTTWQRILKIKCSNPFKQLCLLLFVLRINPFQLNRDILLAFHFHARNDGNVLAPEV